MFWLVNSSIEVLLSKHPGEVMCEFNEFNVLSNQLINRHHLFTDSFVIFFRTLALVRLQRSAIEVLKRHYKNR